MRLNAKSFLIVFFTSVFLGTSAVLAMPMIGDKVPGFITPSVSGENVALRDFWEKGGSGVVILSFFATYNDVCTSDLLYLQGLQDRYGVYGFQVVCTLTQDAVEQNYVRSYLKRTGLRLPVLLDEFGIIGDRYGVALPPTHYIIEYGILKGFYLNLQEGNRKDFEGLLSDALGIPIGVPIPAPSNLLPPY